MQLKEAIGYSHIRILTETKKKGVDRWLRYITNPLVLLTLVV